MMPALRQTFARLPSLAGDTALTVVAVLFAAGQLLFGFGHDHGSLPSIWVLLLAMLCASALLARSRWPIATVIAVGALAILFLWVSSIRPESLPFGSPSSGPPPGIFGGPPPGQPSPGLFPLLPAVLIALYSAVASGASSRLRVWGTAVGVAAAIDLANILTGRGDLGAHLSPVLQNSAWMAMALLFGEALHSRHAYAQEAELRAVEAVRVQQEAAQRQIVDEQRRLAEERLRIARELHDVLAHTVALINIQAGVAAHVIDQQPEQARVALTHIKEASRSTLQELRALVGVLREGDSPAPLAPSPGLGTLDDLIASVRAAGLSVDLETDARPPNGHLPATVDGAAYRILQEALTNVIKHAGPTSVTVTVHECDTQLQVSVINQGRAGARPLRGEGLGQGIAGMRERAAAVGGTLEAGPLPSGGFQVRAVLPVPGGSR
jgi:signal transduction histidine kinase